MDVNIHFFFMWFQDKEIPLDAKIEDLYQKRLFALSEKDSCPEHLMPAVQTADVPCQEGTIKKPILEMVESAAVPQQEARVGASG